MTYVEPKKKIMTPVALARRLSQHRKQGKRIAFTNGCFDILHAGHVSYLNKAQKKNRILIVGLNSDVSVKKIKGSPRPIVSQDQRALILASMACVDYITIFDEETPQKLISFLKPDILIKGADWKGKRVAGSDVVESYGGRVEYINYVGGISSSKIIQKITRGKRNR